jgi:hypothetical protein
MEYASDVMYPEAEVPRCMHVYTTIMYSLERMYGNHAQTR